MHTTDQLRGREQMIEELHAAIRAQSVEIEALRAKLSRDVLTGLLNRRSFDERMEQEIATAERSPAYCFSVVVVDVNGFKQINDSKGHQAGDEALCRVAHFLEDAVRGFDVVFRTGGDEFTLILPATENVGALHLISRLQARVSESEELPGLSFGSATSRVDGLTADCLVSVADERMYQNKLASKKETLS